jgi:hypothetical protein
VLKSSTEAERRVTRCREVTDRKGDLHLAHNQFREGEHLMSLHDLCWDRMSYFNKHDFQCMLNPKQSIPTCRP